MRKFKFRLQRVLDFRLRLEEKAEKQYSEAKMQRELAQQQLNQMRESLQQSFSRSEPFNIERMQQRTLYIEAIEDRMRQQEIIIDTLAQDEIEQRNCWLAARRDREMIDKLRDKAQQHYQYEVELTAQRELDEWATLRRKTA